MFLAVIIPEVEEVTNVRFSIRSQTRDIRVSIRNVLLLFQAPLCSCQEFRSKQCHAWHVHHVKHRHLRCFTSPEERGSPPRRTLAPLVLIAKVRLGCEPVFFPSRPTYKCAIKCTSLIKNMVPMPAIPCSRNSSMRENSPSALAKSENDHRCLLQNKSPVLLEAQYTHTHTAYTRT